MKATYLLMALVGLVGWSAQAQSARISPQQSEVLKALLATFTVQAQEEAVKLGAANSQPSFSATRGRAFFLKRRTWQAHDFTCSGCHTENPAHHGTHMQTRKPIPPLAPAANPARFTDAAKVEANLAQHCADLYGRDCYAQEKGDFIAYLMSIK